MDSYIRTHVNRTGRWIRKHMRGTEEERPESVRVSDEIMQFLIKRETSLADAFEALTMVLLNSLGRIYGQREEFSRFFEQVSSFLEPTERNRPIGLIRLPGAPNVQPGNVTMVERPEGIYRLATGVGEVMAKCEPRSIKDGFNGLTGTMLTAIEAACGRERADEFDLLMAQFSEGVHRLPGNG